MSNRLNIMQKWLFVKEIGFMHKKELRLLYTLWFTVTAEYENLNAKIFCSLPKMPNFNFFCKNKLKFKI